MQSIAQQKDIGNEEVVERAHRSEEDDTESVKPLHKGSLAQKANDGVTGEVVERATTSEDSDVEQIAPMRAVQGTRGERTYGLMQMRDDEETKDTRPPPKDEEEKKDRQPPPTTGKTGDDSDQES